MLQLFASGLVNNWLQKAEVLPAQYDPIPHVSTWQGLPFLNPPRAVEAPVQQSIAAYLQTLKTMGLDPQQQGLWLQTDTVNLIDHRSRIPASAASLTKTATTLAALKTWGLNKRFDTQVGVTGAFQQGVLNGDLVILGAGDPLFVWEDAQALAYSLNQIGIRQVTGNLVIVGDFAMNYQKDPLKAGELLKQGLSGTALPQNLVQEQLKDVNVIKAQSAKLSSLGKFQVQVNGSVALSATLPPNTGAVIRHRSLPLLDILREMNIYSNNEIAQMLADGVGGASTVMQIAATTAGFSPTEIQLINGSGLGVQNQIAPHAASQIFRTIHSLVQPQGLTVADLFPSSGLDTKGSMLDRHLPLGTTVKTGTLNEVSALTGALPTRDRGLVWFTIINRGTQIAQLRQQQDKLLQTLLGHWGKTDTTPWGIARHYNTPAYLGDPQRNEILIKQSSQR